MFCQLHPRGDAILYHFALDQASKLEDRAVDIQPFHARRVLPYEAMNPIDHVGGSLHISDHLFNGLRCPFYFRRLSDVGHPRPGV
jgi:hypothetical protein